MKTQEQIVKFYRAEKEDDFLGLVGEVLLPYLPYEDAKEFLGPSAIAEKWGDAQPLTQDNVLSSMREYMEFAWEKALGHRGLSASRSVEKMRAWCWLLDDEENYRFAGDDGNYQNYGAPILKKISEAYSFPIPDDAAVERMAKGLPCREGCDEGCA